MLLTPKLYRKILERYKEDKSMQADADFETYLCSELGRIQHIRANISAQKKAIVDHDKFRKSLEDELKRLYRECPHYMFSVETCYEDKSATCDLCGAEL